MGTYFHDTVSRKKNRARPHLLLVAPSVLSARRTVTHRVLFASLCVQFYNRRDPSGGPTPPALPKVRQQLNHTSFVSRAQRAAVIMSPSPCCPNALGPP